MFFAKKLEPTLLQAPHSPISQTWCPPHEGPPGMSVLKDYWHHGPPDRSFVHIPEIATNDARSHRRGGSGAWYGTDGEEAMIAEVRRHFSIEGMDPALIVRQVGTVRVRLGSILNLVDPNNRDAIGVSNLDLTSESYEPTQLIADWARETGYRGLLVPSAALHGATNVVVFAGGELGMELIRAHVSTVEEILARAA